MRILLSFVLVCSILASCSTSNQVVSNKLFQKRKYQKGWHINSSKTLKKEKGGENIAVNHKSNESVEVYSDSSFIEDVSITSEKNINIATEVFPLNTVKHQSLRLVKKKIIGAKEKLVSFATIPQQKMEVKWNSNKEVSLASPIDRSDKLNRVLLALLAIVVLYFSQIGPLAILIGVGKVESIKINLIIWLAGIVVLAMAVISALLIGGTLTGSVLALLIIGGVLVFGANIHALVVIIRGY